MRASFATWWKRSAVVVDVLMLSAAHPPDDVRIVRKEGAALAAAGWRVLHLCPGGPAPAAIAGVAIQTYDRRPGWWGRLRNIPRLARLARALRPRVIQAHEPDAWLAALLARHGQVVLDVHEHYPSRLDAWLPALLRGPARWALRAMCRAMARGADAVVVAKDGLAEDYGRACVAVRNYAEAPRVQPRLHAPGPVMLLHLGAISRARGWPQLLAALTLTEATLTEAAPTNAALTLAGPTLAGLTLAGPTLTSPTPASLTIAGRFTDGSEADFHAEAARRGLTPRIRMLGWLSPDAMAAEAARADINLVLFQPGEENHRLALPHKLADGMLAGLPVIAPAFATEVATMVTEARCGLLVDVTDPADIAAAIARLGDPALRARLGAAGRDAAMGRYGWAGQAAALVALHTRLLGSPERAAV